MYVYGHQLAKMFIRIHYHKSKVDKRHGSQQLLEAKLYGCYHVSLTE